MSYLVGALGQHALPSKGVHSMVSKRLSIKALKWDLDQPELPWKLK